MNIIYLIIQFYFIISKVKCKIYARCKNTVRTRSWMAMLLRK